LLLEGVSVERFWNVVQCTENDEVLTPPNIVKYSLGIIPWEEVCCHAAFIFLELFALNFMAKGQYSVVPQHY